MTYYHLSFHLPKWVESRLTKMRTRVDGESKIKTAYIKLTGSFALDLLHAVCRCPYAGGPMAE